MEKICQITTSQLRDKKTIIFELKHIKTEKIEKKNFSNFLITKAFSKTEIANNPLAWIPNANQPKTRLACEDSNHYANFYQNGMTFLKYYNGLEVDFTKKEYHYGYWDENNFKILSTAQMVYIITNTIIKTTEGRKFHPETNIEKNIINEKDIQIKLYDDKLILTKNKYNFCWEPKIIETNMPKEKIQLPNKIALSEEAMQIGWDLSKLLDKKREEKEKQREEIRKAKEKELIELAKLVKETEEKCNQKEEKCNQKE